MGSPDVLMRVSIWSRRDNDGDDDGDGDADGKKTDRKKQRERRVDEG
jgi:hypothetical protein